MRRATALALAALLCFSAAAAVSAQDFPPGLFDDVNAVAAMPGAVSSYASSVSGQAPVTKTSGPVPGGSAMASASSTGVKGKTMTSTTVNGVTTTTTSGTTTGSCSSVSSFNGKACDGPAGGCCSITADVKRCKGFMSARTNINGVQGRCCITLFRAKDKSPALWCGGPASRAYYSLPSSARVALKPSCATSFAGSKAGSLSCVVTMKALPKGFVAPRGYTSAKPLLYNKGTGFNPCMSPSFSRVMQADSTSKDGAVVITSKCE